MTSTIETDFFWNDISSDIDELFASDFEFDNPGHNGLAIKEEHEGILSSSLEVNDWKYHLVLLIFFISLIAMIHDYCSCRI